MGLSRLTAGEISFILSDGACSAPRPRNRRVACAPGTALPPRAGAAEPQQLPAGLHRPLAQAAPDAGHSRGKWIRLPVVLASQHLGIAPAMTASRPGTPALTWCMLILALAAAGYCHAALRNIDPHPDHLRQAGAKAGRASEWQPEVILGRANHSTTMTATDGRRLHGHQPAAGIDVCSCRCALLQLFGKLSVAT